MGVAQLFPGLWAKLALPDLLAVRTPRLPAPRQSRDLPRQSRCCGPCCLTGISHRRR